MEAAARDALVEWKWHSDEAESMNRLEGQLT